MNSLTTFIMGLFFRWFPHRAPTGLRAVGQPNESSPVLVTCNYTLTVSQVLRRLKGLDVWLLVANSNGINVWCAACGGGFTDHQVISAVKTSLLDEKVEHRTLILPPLSAPAMDRERIRKETGFKVQFGPVRAKDIPAYLAGGKRKTEDMKRASFGLGHRLDMVVGMNFVIWIPLAVVFALFWPHLWVHSSRLFWGIVLFMYILFPWIPGRNGWEKALTTALVTAGAYVTAGYLIAGEPFAYWPWMVGGVALALAVGFDLAGIAGPMPSDVEAFLQRLGIRSFGFLLSEKTTGKIAQDRDACSGCRNCHDLCPVQVYDLALTNKKTVLARPDDCFSCGACVKQCPENALSLTRAD